MKRRQSPQAKKQEAYERDHYVLAEYPHAFRRSWPKKKRHANQAHRRKVRQALSGVSSAADAGEAENRARSVANWPIRRKWGVVSLRERVAYRLRVRRNRLGWNFFRSPYHSQRDREPFVRFLEALTAGQTDEATALAAVVRTWLTPSGQDAKSRSTAARSAWLAAFFQDEPEWEVRLEAWVQALAGDSDEGTAS